MKGAARQFFILAVCYAVAGMALGIHMAASHDHGQMPTHAHIDGGGLGDVLRLRLLLSPVPRNRRASRLARAHFWIQAVSGVVLVVSLFFLLGGNEAIEPVTALASVGFLLGMLLFIWNAMPVLRTA